MAVELSDYMRRVLKWSWLIAVVTVAGGVIALLLTSQSSTTFVTSATVAPPGDVATAAQAQQYVNDFQAAAGSRAVQEAVTTDTEVARGTVGERVTVNRVGDSGLVSVTYRTPVQRRPQRREDRPERGRQHPQPHVRVEGERRPARRRRRRRHDRERPGRRRRGPGSRRRVPRRPRLRGADRRALQSVQDQITSFEISEVAARASGNVAGANTFAHRPRRAAEQRVGARQGRRRLHRAAGRGRLGQVAGGPGPGGQGDRRPRRGRGRSRRATPTSGAGTRRRTGRPPSGGAPWP